MKIGTVKNKVSLFFFIFAIGCVLTFILLDVLFYSYNIKNKLMDNASELLTQKELQFSSSVKKLENILLSVKDLNHFKKYQKDYKKHKNSMNDIFLMLVQHDKNIMQLRYIDSSGIEQIRVDRSNINAKSKIISQENLQNKSSRYYFTNSIPKDSEVWYSNLDLNIEKGKVEIPYKPTLRAILPLKQNNTFNGILIINYFMDEALNNLINITTHNAYIVNELGDSLVHYDKSQSWSHYRDTSFDLKNDYLLNLYILPDNFFYKDSDILVKILPLNLHRRLFVIFKINNENLEELYKDRFLHYILLTIAILLLSVLMSIIFSKYLKHVFLILKDSKTLNKILNIKVKKQTQELFDSKKKLSDIITNINDFIWEMDINLKYTYLSPQIESILGYKSHELLGNTPFDIMPKDEALKISKFIENIVKTSKPIIQLTNKNIHKDGHIVYLETSGNPILDEHNQVVGYRGSDRDVTQKINSQKIIDENFKQIKILNKQLKVEVFDEIEKNRKKDMQLFAQSKMASMGEMIANIAHQWRQPLSAISTLASGVKVKQEFKLLKTEDIPKTMDEIVHFTEQLSKTIETFMNFLKEKKEFRNVSINKTIQDSINILISSLNNNNIKIINNLNIKEDNTLNTIPGELQEVLINILNNSKDALLEKNIINPTIIITLIQNKKELIIQIEDNAGGIPKNIIDKIFDPYFTTKHATNGTGLGLHMSYRVITESLKGELYAENINAGVTFYIKLPYLD